MQGGGLIGPLLTLVELQQVPRPDRRVAVLSPNPLVVGVRGVDMPFTPMKVWEALRDAPLPLASEKVSP